MNKPKNAAPLRPTAIQRAGNVVKRSLLLCIPALALNLFFQGRREFEKEIRACLKNRKRRLYAQKRPSSVSKILVNRQVDLRFSP